MSKLPLRPHEANGAHADLSVEGLVLDIDRFASHDGPGIRTAVFLKGCPLACTWCHSPESQHSQTELLYQEQRCTGCWECLAVCPTGALTRGIRGQRPVAVLDRTRCNACGNCVAVCYPGALKMAGGRVTVGELVEDVSRDRPFFDSSGGGVTLSGGEPAAQPRFSLNFLMACREIGIHTALETTGYGRWNVISALAQAADLVMYDLKFIDAAAHQRHTGVANSLILENLRRLANEHPNVLVRVPCISGVNDDPQQIQSTADFVKGIGLTHIQLLPYNGAAGAKYEWLGRTFALAGRETQPDAFLDQLGEICRNTGLSVQVGG